MKAVGSKCTNAVAIRTPVPKCWERNMKRFGPSDLEDRRDIRGNPQAERGRNIVSQVQRRGRGGGEIQIVLRISINTSAYTCAEVL